MPRRKRPPETERSEYWLRRAVNEHRAWFDDQVRARLELAPSDLIDWRSPIEPDEYAEYYDGAFLDRLGLAPDRLSVPLEQFWPSGGPRWDGLARTSSGAVILIEAKAYVEEAVDFRSQAGEESLKAIRASLAKAKEAFRASARANWEEPFYQYANRLAHLYYLRALNGVDAHLVFVCFAGAPDVPRATSAEAWSGAIRVIECGLGLGAHPFKPYVHHLVVDVDKLTS